MYVVTNEAPPIRMSFDPNLLSTAILKLNEDSETLYRIYQILKKKLMKRAERNPKQKKACEELEKDFLELYERAKAKEKDAEAAPKNVTQRSFYRIAGAKKNDRAIFERFKYAFRRN